MESERRSERYPSDRPIAIRCETWTEFVETYASDVCRGGMFVRSETTPEVLSQVELKLNLPEGMEVALTARVVHVVPREQAERHHGVPGIGVEFVHVDAEQRRQILQLVEFARAQAEGTVDPNLSFAKALADSTSSIPARDIAARLSTLPESGDAARARKASQVAMQAVQIEPAEERGDPSQVAVRARPNTQPLERQRIMRTPTQPLSDAVTERSSATNPIVRPQTQPLGDAATARSSATNPIVRPQTGPITGATGRSSATNPIVRTPTQPLGDAATGRSSATNPIVRSPTGPLTGATGKSSATNPIVRTPTGPLTGATAKSSAANPIVRTPTGPVTPANANATGRSSATNPIVRTPSGQIARPATGPIDPNAFAAGQPPSGPNSGVPGSPSGSPDAAAATTTPSGQPLPPAKPTDLNRLKLVMNALNHKHFEDAARMAREMLADNPGDPQVLKWQALCFARMAGSRGDPAAAAQYYEKVLHYEENHREAREFVKAFQRDKKLNAIPFGRYFTTKKK